MAYVNPSTQTVKNCFQSHYSLPYFQREYKWESKHFTELLDDIQNAFLLSYEVTHGRKDVSDYAPYFLGSIITSTGVGGKKPLIDGQQRLTSTFLILAYLERYRREYEIADALDLSPLLGNISFGSMDYSIEFSESRKAIFDNYLNKQKTTSEAIASAEDVPNLDDGDKKVLEAFRTTEALLNSTVRDAIAYFIDYVVERVLLIDISVESESEAHRVFVTMNDRGLRLGPIDLLKGQILSKITTPADSHACHSIWIATINKLREIDPEEDSLFFRNIFRAKWANSIRGKSKGDTPGDFDLIGDAYHRWFENNAERLSLITADDYVRFVKHEITKYAEVYAFIKKSENELIEGHEHIYYNAIRRFGFQSMILLASIKPNDTTSIWKKKIASVSKLIDILLTSRTIEGKINNYDNLKDISFQLSRDIRNKNSTEISDFIKEERDYPLDARSQFLS